MKKIGMTLTEVRTRPSWDEYFLGIAKAVSSRGDCRRSQVGAIITNWENRVISSGYNGVLPGLEGCIEGACPRGLQPYSLVAPYSPYTDCIATHAEMNAIEYLDSGEGLTFPSGLTLYCTREPCTNCYLAIEYFGITRVVY